MERREKPLGAGTMSNYVLALKRFCEFLHGRQDRVLAIVPDLHSWTTLTQHINRVYTTYNVEKTKEQVMRRIDQSQLLDGLTVWGYTTSDLAVRVNELLLSAGTPLDVTVEAYTLVRGHILMLLEILNGKRAGDFRNLTMQEWQEGSMVGIDYIVRVRRHKVITKPCNINFPGPVYNYMKTFIKYYRPIVLKKGVDTENVFLGTTGSQLTSSQIVDAMNKCWQIYGCEIDEQLPRFTTTRARKLIVTIHRSTSQTKASQDDLAAHMAHSPAVADRWYDMGQGTFRSSRAGGIIMNDVWAKVLEKTAVGVETTEEENIDGDVDDPSDVEEDDEEDVDAMSGELDGQSVSTRRDGSGRLPVSQTVAPKDKVVKDKVVKVQKLSSSSSSQRKPPKIVGPGIIPDTDSDSAPEAEPDRSSDRGAAPDLPRVQRARTWTKLWSDEDAALLQRCFQSYISERRANRDLKVTAADIKTKLKSEPPPFSSLLDNYGATKIAERLRYLVRKKP
ncbi:unnamed protein product [Mytilus edulis]|uniref:Uncharacterized protein n=1 Tax=Mytilus edulis TaxID=6550 RepID=A0A8S3SSE9_MYTED|nr:unnamed protein product [Mytilus edulis]